MQPDTTDSGSTTNPDDSGTSTPPGDDSGSVHPGDDASSPAGNDSGGTPPTSDASVSGPNGGYPAGWLYTDGNKIMVSTGSTGTQWMGRGVNMDDIFMCGYNSTLYRVDPEKLAGDRGGRAHRGLEAELRPHVALDEQLQDRELALSTPAQYQTPMTNVIESSASIPACTCWSRSAATLR